ncbi:YheC/YheD family protein [Paenibacillus hodogayensis]|uniref:YheC/YheD family protein n=1 Tax=Paenibacillus hodogayensis TaxID=279208 RepID=A0ABV5VYD6_9BACL
MKKAKGIHVMSKWTKTKALLRHKEMQPLVPETRLMNADSLRRMLRRYSMVYIKPVSGSFGNGVMRVEQKGGARGTVYTYQHEQKKRSFPSFDAMYRSIMKHKRKRPYLAQKGIRLLKHRGRSFDIRVMVQRNSGKQWETTGIIGRVAHPAKIITNYHGGGTPMDIRPLLTPWLKGDKVAAYERRLAKVGKNAAVALSHKYPRINMVGADIGVDSELKPWIIELNTNPDPYIFRHLKDRSVYRKVLHYARKLGRIPAKKR